MKSLPNKWVKISLWPGVKVVGDNIDEKFKPSFQRLGALGLDLHHFHGYAVFDRLDLSKCSDVTPTFREPDPEQLMPSLDDISALKTELGILVQRYV